MSEKIVELGKHSATVASVIERLDRYQDEIEHISVVTTWKKDGSITISGDDKKLSTWVMHEKVLAISNSEEILHGMGDGEDE